MISVGASGKPGPQADGPRAVVAVTTHEGAGSDAGQFDRLGNYLAMAGLRLARLRARLPSAEDRLMLIQARSDLDEAIAEVRRLALSARQREGS